MILHSDLPVTQAYSENLVTIALYGFNNRNSLPFAKLSHYCCFLVQSPLAADYETLAHLRYDYNDLS